MKETIEQLKKFYSSRVYVVIVGIAAFGAYGFAVTHPSVGVDDTAVSLYFEDGLNSYWGRWSLFVINRVFHIHIGDFAPWLVEMISVLILMLSVTLWCILWQRICEPIVRIPVWAYALVAGIFISCPIISEVFVFYLHGGICTGYGVVALALLCLLNSLQRERGKKILWNILFSSFLLCIALGFYESFVAVYIMGAIILFFLNRFLYGKKEGSSYRNGLMSWGGVGAAALVMALAERTIILAVLKIVYRLEETMSIYAPYRKLFGDIFTAENELQMVLKRFWMKYYINALTYLPITVLVLAFLGIGICSLYYGIRKKDVLLPVCTAGLMMMPIAMSLVEGLATRYRSAQYVPVVCAFAVFLLFVLLYLHKPPKILKGCCAVFLSILLFNQASEMNKWFYVDYLKYQDMVRVMDNVAYDLKKDYDTSKPVVFRGSYAVPYEIAKPAYVDFNSWQFRMICMLTDPIDVHIKEKYYAYETPAYVSAETPIISAMSWGITAFDGTCQQLINFWNMHGIGGIHCLTDMALIEEAEKIRTEENMPAYPQDGYIKECDDYIIINMSN